MRTEGSPRFHPLSIEPTAEQRAIQAARWRVCLVHANAGAAKTTTLALRLAEALAWGAAPSSLLALVFTEEARQVLRQRLLEIGVAPARARQIPVQTFEQFAEQILLKGEQVSVPRIEDAAALRPYVLQALEQVSNRYAQRYEYLDIRTHHVAVSQFLECQQRLKASMLLESDDASLDAEDRAIHAQTTLTDYLCAHEFEALRNSRYDGVMFRSAQDATYDLAKNLQEEEFWHDYLPTCRLIVADELHDMNESAFQVLCALLDKGDVFFVGAGDKDQVIHRAAGADEAFLLERFRDRYPATRSLPLTQTYRHGPHLAFAVEHFKNKVVSSALPEHTGVELSLYNHHEPQAAAQATLRAVRKWVGLGHGLNSCAILLRDTHQSVVLENALLQAGVPYRIQGFTSYLQRREILFIQGLLALSIGALETVPNTTRRGDIVAALAFFAELSMDDHTLEQAQAEIAEYPELLQSFFHGQIERTAPEMSAQRMRMAIELLTREGAEANAANVLQHVCEALDLQMVARRLFVHEEQARVIQKSIQGLIAIAEQQNWSLKALYDWLGTAGSAPERRGDQAVVLECVAQSKGKEYPHVLLPWLELGEFPAEGAVTQEEENLFYVAITRTQQQLSLIVPQEVASQSPFVARLGLTQVDQRANEALRQNQQRQQARPYQAVTRQAAPSFREPQPTKDGRLVLAVPYAEKDEAKALGAMWDPAGKVWYVPAGKDHRLFERWLPT
jgi:DNA helicase-2/ATP-dependent DNA helicase PcrA